MSEKPLLREPVVNGRFYPDDPQELGAVVDHFLSADSSVECPDAPSIMVMLPHAGYVYSGVVAGAALNLSRPYDRCILLGPNHTGRGKPLSVWPSGHWRTPLGLMPVDAELAQGLIELGVGFEENLEAHLGEHSLEVLLPFLQRKFADDDVAKHPITPICVSVSDLEVLRLAGQALGKLLVQRAKKGQFTTLIVSSDMSHYIPHHEAGRLDAAALERLCALDPEGLFNVVKEKGISMCGIAPATLALFAALELGATQACKVAYATSGQTGAAFGASLDSVVGYAGVIVA